MEAKKLTPLQVVKEKCRDCCGGGNLKEARQCEIAWCALYHHRAGKKDGKQTMTASRAIKEYCKQCCNGNAQEPGKCTAKNCPVYIFKQQKGAEREEKRRQKREQIATREEEVNNA